MLMTSAELALDVACTLGEGPVWSDRALWFVDIEGRALHRFDPKSIAHKAFAVPDRIGFAVPSERGDWLVAQGTSLAWLKPGLGEPVPMLDIEPAEAGTRLNDAKPDPTGRLYAGTMHLSAATGAGALYRIGLDNSACSRIVDNVTISNGLAWHEPNGTMYYIDTATGGIDAFDWCPETGEIQGRRRAAAVAGGVPDGMAIDAEGMLWVAVWGGSRVARIDPTTGRETGSVSLPCAQVTSCCFGGDDLSQLWITTARIGLSEAELAEQPLAGGLFVADVAVNGAPVPRVK